MTQMSPEFLARSLEDPSIFFERTLGWKPWAKQTDIARALAAALRGQGPRRVAVRSGNGVGKTALAARLMLWALCCYESSVVVTTAPTQRQVTELLWREARSAYYRARVRLGGRFYQGRARWDLGPRRYAIGVSPEHTRPEAFQGFHADLILFLVDEASGVPAAHWEAIKGSLLAGNAAVLAIGNPTRLEGEFHDAFHGQAALWRRMHISAFDTPNLTGGNIPGLVTPSAVADAARDWGEESPLYQIRVLGEFPSAASHQLIRFEWIEAAAAAPAAGGGFALGVDVARSGEDETAAVLLEGNRLARLQRWLGQNTMRDGRGDQGRGGRARRRGRRGGRRRGRGRRGRPAARAGRAGLRGEVRGGAGRAVVGALQEQAGGDVLAAAGAVGGGDAAPAA